MIAEPLSNLVELEPKVETPFAKTVTEIYRLVDSSKEMVGGADSAATIMSIDRGDLRRALDRKGRYLAIEHVMAFNERLVQFSPETAQRINAAFVRVSDMLVYPRVQLTAAERARRMENMLRAMSAASGVDLVSKALETP